MSVTVACPGCGATVEFRFDTTFVRVCDHCRGLVARSDRGVDMLGKAADLHVSDSPLRLWLEGRYQGVGFALTGRAQLRHARGGGWDEWYASFADGRVGWLAEAQGRFLLTFAQQLDAPPRAQVDAGEAVTLGGERFAVAEVGEGEYAAAEGEIPFRLEPGHRFPFADLSGTDGRVATIDYGDEPPAVHVGREVTLAELGLAGAGEAERAGASVRGKGVTCPNCGGPLELRAPDRTLRVRCPYCGALLDAEAAELKVLQLLDRPTALDIPLGTVLELEGQRLTVIGCIERSAHADDMWWPFHEYLLYHPELGFRWLVHSDGHWSYVRPVPAGEVTDRGDATHAGRRFRQFTSAPLRVDAVWGEVYWQVKIGEESTGTDYIAPPLMLSREDEGSEVHWSLGTWMPASEVSRLCGLPLPGWTPKVAPHQPYRHGFVYRLWLGALALVILLGLVSMCRGGPTEVYRGDHSIEAGPAPAPGGAAPTVIYTEPIHLAGGKNIRVRARAPVSNSWAYVAGDLIDEASGDVHTFDVEVAYYSGVDGGESWSEGGPENEVFLGAVPEGDYVLRLELQAGAQGTGRPPPMVSVAVDQGVFRPLYWLLALGGVSLLPLLVGLHHFMFERARWRDSDFPPGWATWSPGDDE